MVVDNASTDGTGSFAMKWSARLPGFRVVREPKPGLANARARAFEVAQMEHVCFVDDDNLLAPDYLEVAAGIIDRFPEVGIVGGRSELFPIAGVPGWFDDVASSYAVGAPHDAEGEVPPGQVLWGAGLIVRRSAFVELLQRQFSPMLAGRLGNHQLAGDDAELCLALNLIGVRSYYSHRMSLMHAIEPSRMNLESLRRMAFGFGLSMVTLEVYRSYFQTPPKRLIKRSDVLLAVFLAMRWLRAVLPRMLQRSPRTRLNLWSVQGALHAFFVEGVRPSRVLRHAFLRNL